MDLRKMLAMISDPLDQWSRTPAGQGATEIRSIKVETNGFHGGVNINISFKDISDFYSCLIEVPQVRGQFGKDIIFHTPKRLN